MSEVYDLDAVAAEVAKEPFRFRYRGQDWSLAHLSDVDWRVVSKADTGDLEAVHAALRAGLGDEQWTAWEQVPQPISAMTKLFDRWLHHSGLRAGESPASTDSFESTAGPSQRPSGGTTRARRSAKSLPAT